MSGAIYRFSRCMSRFRVVFSIDFTMTRVLGVRGALLRLRGLNESTALRMRFDVVGRVRIRTESVFNVASTMRASLQRCGHRLGQPEAMVAAGTGGGVKEDTPAIVLQSS